MTLSVYRLRASLATLLLSAAATAAIGAASAADNPPTAKYPSLPSETPAHFKPDHSSFGYTIRDVMIPMRDGIKLHTVIMVPKGAHDAPMLLTRTPYNASGMVTETQHDSLSGDMGTALEGYDNAVPVIVNGGYIRVIQDVRGKYGSEGDFVMNRPFRGPLNHTPVDESTDTYDTIDWLVKHVPESNGRVGILGISYDGYEPLTALINPNPALKVVVPMNPMVDGWMGDDWFHNGAFREQNLPYIYEQEATRDSSAKWWSNYYDDYDLYMHYGSAGAMGKTYGMGQIGFWNKIVAHPAYDSFWSEQAMDKILARQPLKVPVMLVDSLWDQEDIYGAMAVYKAIKPRDTHNDMV
ncbi:MAG TPA: CocE/NonD family hydrolase, partial [Stellaceae bacterium]|nr:CocE/NonD family hydrolase [Stellaceae bacterium]